MQPTPRLRLHLTEFNEFWCLSISTGVIRKYEEKAHTSSLHRDINVCANFLSHGNEREAERARGQAPALPPWVPALVQTPITEWSTPLQRSHRADRNAYIICYIWSSESRDINKEGLHIKELRD